MQRPLQDPFQAVHGQSPAAIMRSLPPALVSSSQRLAAEFTYKGVDRIPPILTLLCKHPQPFTILFSLALNPILEMKFIIIVSLISLAVASPVAISSGSAAVSKNDIAARLFTRAAAVISCEIVNTSSVSVNCRSGPTLGSSVTDDVFPGVFYDFSCYKNGDCYNGIW